MMTAKTPKTAAGSVDPALLPYLHVRSNDEAERLLLGALFREHVEPVGRAVVRRRLRSPRTGVLDEDAADEAFGELLTQLLRRLRLLREEWHAQTGGLTPAIGHLDGYIAVAAGRACDDLMRRRFPARARLKNRVRYLLGHTGGLALWEGGGPGGVRTALCGYAAWRDSGSASPPAVSVTAADPAADPAAFLRTRLPGGEIAAARLVPGALCAALFDAAGGPVPLDDLVDLLALLWRIEDVVAASPAASAAETAEGDALAGVGDPAADVAGAAERRERLLLLWDQVRQLPHRQCAALLLNLRDTENRGVIALLPLLDIATVAEIAAAVQIDPDEFAELWDRLPIDDATIAGLLGATRQQVINLRKVARERLSRRAATSAD